MNKKLTAQVWWWCKENIPHHEMDPCPACYLKRVWKEKFGTEIEGYNIQWQEDPPNLAGAFAWAAVEPSRGYWSKINKMIHKTREKLAKNTGIWDVRETLKVIVWHRENVGHTCIDTEDCVQCMLQKAFGKKMGESFLKDKNYGKYFRDSSLSPNFVNAFHWGKFGGYTYWLEISKGKKQPVNNHNVAKPEVQTPVDFEHPPFYDKKNSSQKTDGLAWLTKKSSFSVPTFLVWPTQFRTFDKIVEKKLYFMRPAPALPQHGFVDSRVVNNEEEFGALVQEVIAEDPYAEIIAMEPIEAPWSAVATATGVALGKGHDSVTGGGKSFGIACINDFALHHGGFFTPNLDSAWHPLKKNIFLEFVADKKKVWCVQLRFGPETPQEANFIPKKVKVEHILYPIDYTDLLEWAKLLKHEVKMPGVVVSGRGISLASHYAVHAILNNIPVVTDKTIEIGDTLVPVKSRVAEGLSKSARKQLARYLKGLFGKDVAPSKEVVRLAVAGFHSQVFWGEDDHLLRLRAWAIVGLIRCLTAACLGEMRHWYSLVTDDKEHSLNYYCERMPFATALEQFQKPCPIELHKIFGVDKIGIDRSTVYKKTKTFGFKEMLGYADICGKAFLEFRSSSYGGKPWSDGAKSLAIFMRSVESFVKSPTSARYTDLVGAWNIAMGAAHNGGKLLDKWVPRQSLEVLDRCPGPAFVSQLCWNIVSKKAKTPSQRSW